jgi:hypothetical protein
VLTKVAAGFVAVDYSPTQPFDFVPQQYGFFEVSQPLI